MFSIPFAPQRLRVFAFQPCIFTQTPAMKTDARVDAYIQKAQPFAQPILQHLRSLVHRVCPTAEETMKWSFPHFMYKGDMLCSMASFKQHAVFGFWKAPLMKDPVLQQTATSEVAMGHLGKITSLKDLPSDKQIMAWIQEAMALNDQGIKLPKKPAAKAPVAVPDYITEAMQQHAQAWAVWEAFAPSHRKEYVQWITEAKTEATRQKRLMQTIEWVAAGKSRNWQYEKK